MEKIKLKIPKNLECKTERSHPLEKFYNNLAKRIDKNLYKKKRIDVTSVYINPKDSKDILKEIENWVCKIKPFYSKNKIKTQVGLIWLDLGPVEDKNVEVGFCEVDKEYFFKD
jgi:hypothetical protein